MITLIPYVLATLGGYLVGHSLSVKNFDKGGELLYSGKRWYEMPQGIWKGKKYYADFRLDDNFNPATMYDGVKYTIKYDGDRSQLYSLFEDHKKIKSSKSSSDLVEHTNKLISNKK